MTGKPGNGTETEKGKKVVGRVKMSKLVIVLATVAVLLPLTATGGLVAADRHLEGKVSNNKEMYESGRAVVEEISAQLYGNPADSYPEANIAAHQDIDIPEMSRDPLVWEQEIFAGERSREIQQGTGPDLGRMIEPALVDRPYRIMLIGDSYTLGMYHRLNADNYVRRLEQLLGRTAAGQYEIIPVATDQASFLRQSDWVTRARLARIRPDAVILTHTMNRLHPTFLEQKYCVEFNSCPQDNMSRPFDDAMAHDLDQASTKWKIIMCLRSEPTPIGTLFRKFLYPRFPNVAEFLAVRYCTDERIRRGVDLPTERTQVTRDERYSPYIGDFETYLRKVRDMVKDQPWDIQTYVVNLAWRPSHMWPPLDADVGQLGSVVQYLFELYEEYGFEEIPTQRTRDAVLVLRSWDLGDVQGSGADLKNNNCVYDCVLSDEQWERNLENYRAGTISHPLKYRPGHRIQDAFAQDLAGFILERFPVATGSVPVPQPIVVDAAPWYLTLREMTDQKVRVQFSTSNVSRVASLSAEIDGRKVSAPCAQLDRPHAEVALNQRGVEGARAVRVGYDGGGYETLTVVFEEENSDGNYVMSRAVELEPGRYVELPDPARIRNVYFAGPSGSCAGSAVQLEPFTATIQLFR